ncbi:hypothetical protein CEP88_15855 [Roseobacter denitrificans]|nr:hypothetical protein CEP88_15855 [Roseobacter denitrificans]
MRRWITLALIASITLIFFYVSRFWYLNLWPRQGLFGIEGLRPQGGLLARWLRGTDAAPYELLIWAIGFFAVLSIAQKIYDRLPHRDD